MGIFVIPAYFLYIIGMAHISEEQANVEWTKFYGKFEELGLSKYYDMDKLQQEMVVSPCTTNEESGTAYKGALLMHIILVMGLAQRIAKMISGTFQVDERSLMKVCMLMHLSKRFMFEESNSDWDIKRGYPFKFKELGGVMTTGERSLLEAMNNGIKFTSEEFEAMKSMDNDDASKKAFQGIMTTIIRQANELAYSIEKERYKKLKNQ